ncbi:hypothetical protein F5X98DRAFT_330978 [Xylaria grammica]|nr:hypothetical protein F5X98DRAFT_330978 [Xylaria grammica]
MAMNTYRPRSLPRGAAGLSTCLNKAPACVLTTTQTLMIGRAYNKANPLSAVLPEEFAISDITALAAYVFRRLADQKTIPSSCPEAYN